MTDRNDYHMDSVIDSNDFSAYLYPASPRTTLCFLSCEHLSVSSIAHRCSSAHSSGAFLHPPTARRTIITSRPGVTMALPGSEVGGDPLDAVIGSSSPTENSNHPSDSGSKATDTTLTRYQTCDSESASALPLIVDQIKSCNRDHTPYLDHWLRYHLSPNDLGALETLLDEKANPGWKLRYEILTH